MDSQTFSIRWHSRAGQGAITVATALAEILGAHGQFVQSFPEFGAEKRGAPVTVFNRISAEPLTDPSQPSELDLVVLLDPTLIASCEVSPETVLKGLKSTGKLLVNTTQQKLDFTGETATYALDASSIAVSEIGRDIPNVPLLGALLALTGLATLESFQAELKSYLARGLSEKIVAGNLKAFEHGYNEVKLLS